jgi:hypothetical protein
MLTRIRILLLALLAVAAVTVSTAGATPPLQDTTPLELEIFDLHVSTACGADVFANVTGDLDRRVYFGKDGAVDHVIEAFHGRIEWFTRGTGKSYSNALVNRTRIDFPDGLDLFVPARLTVTGQHGGTFPIGGGPPGHGTLVYDGFVYAIDDEGFPYVATEGGPISMSGNFETTTRRICKALA